MPFENIIGHSVPITWLRNAIQSQQLAHAYLFVGDEAIGKRMTALQFIQAMNCETHTEASIPDACGQCRACQQIITSIHPDVLFIQPDAGQGQHPQIKIERVREIEHHVIYRPLIGLRKICVIDQADRLTIGAANALLKTLEEPPDHCLFILITSRPLALLATLKSRCLLVRFSSPSQEETTQYLIQQQQITESDARFISFVTNGRLGEALDFDLETVKAKQKEFFSLLFEPTDCSLLGSFEAAEMLSKSGHIPEVLLWLWSGLRDLLLIATQSPQKYLLHQEQLSTLQKLSERTSLTQILNLLDELYQLELGLQRNLNMQLGFEQFFIHLRETIPISSR
ncbi:MAG: DNA polymerase III subunit delta' [Nitrospirales bacterium]